MKTKTHGCPNLTQPQPDKATLENVKAGTVKLPPPVYKSKPYILLSKEDVVLAVGTLEEIKQLDGYYDTFLVEARHHDLDANDNTKLNPDKAREFARSEVERTIAERKAKREKATVPGKHYTTIREESDSMTAEHAALVAVAEAGHFCRQVLNANGGFTAAEKRQATQQMDKAEAQLAAVRSGKGISPGS